MTTTTIWRARCPKCGSEKRSPRAMRDTTYCYDCGASATWQSWEVSEERYWRVMDGDDLSHFFETKALAEEAMGKAEVAIRGEITGPVSVVRRTLKKVKP